MKEVKTPRKPLAIYYALVLLSLIHICRRTFPGSWGWARCPGSAPDCVHCRPVRSPRAMNLAPPGARWKLRRKSSELCTGLQLSLIHI